MQGARISAGVENTHGGGALERPLFLTAIDATFIRAMNMDLKFVSGKWLVCLRLMEVSNVVLVKAISLIDAMLAWRSLTMDTEA